LSRKGLYHSRRAGFTLVEILAATAVSSLLVLALGIMLVKGYEEVAARTAFLDLQTDAAISMETIRYAVMNSNETNIVLGASAIDFQEGATTKRIEAQGANLVFDPDIRVTGDEAILVFGRLTAFVPILEPGIGIDFSLALTDGEFSQTYHSLAGFRE
jgi:prepilin-type N-terminal cleavage/methylation domain-containing protein